MGGSGALLDTIVARATPSGFGAVALVRLSGPCAVKVVSALTRRADTEWSDRTSRLRTLFHPRSDEALDRGLVTVFRAPKSYTGEDVVEISTHGGYEIPASVVEACVSLGARPARPGEFTQRAYLNGKLDLTQAEAVADLVAAKSEKGRTVALHQLEQGLGRRIAALRERVIALFALLVQHIDFPEEDEAPTPLETIARDARNVVREIDRLLATAPAGELLREGAMAVLAGLPNSGKSSLFNALLGTERAIVTEEAGTTRDAIEAVISVEGFPFRIVDTAGLRKGTDRLERLGIEVARRYLSAADVVLYCREAGQRAGSPPTERGEDVEEEFLKSLSSPVILLKTKWDLAKDGEAPRSNEIPVSAQSGEGLGSVKAALGSLVFKGVVENLGEVPVVTGRRQAGLLKEARAEVEKFGGGLARGVPPEVASAHLRSAETALEDILGVVATEDVLTRVFKDFCIGK